MAPSYNDSGLTNGQTVFYTVTAVDGTGEGAASAQRSATPAAITHNAAAQLRTRVHLGGSGVVVVKASSVALRIQARLASVPTLVRLTGARLRTQAHFSATAGPPANSPRAVLTTAARLRGTASSIVVPAVSALRVQNRLVTSAPVVIRRAAASLRLQEQLQATYGVNQFTGWSVGGWDAEGWGSPMVPASNLGVSTQLVATGVVVNQAAAQLALRGQLAGSAVGVLPAAASLTDRARLTAAAVVVDLAHGSLVAHCRLQGTGVGVASASGVLTVRASLQAFQGVNSQPATGHITTRAQLSGAGVAVQVAGTAVLSVRAALASALPSRIQIASGASLMARARLTSTAQAPIQGASASLALPSHVGATAQVIVVAGAALAIGVQLAANAAIRRDASAVLTAQTHVSAAATNVLIAGAGLSTTTALSGTATRVIQLTTASFGLQTSLQSLATGPLISPASVVILDNFYVQATATYVVVASALLETTFRLVGEPSRPIVVLDDSADFVTVTRLSAIGIPTGAVQGATFSVSVEETTMLITMVGSP